MKKLKTKRVKVILAAALLTLAPLLAFGGEAHSAQLLSRSLTRSNPAAGEVSNYRTLFDIQTLAVIGSMSFEFCSNSPIPGDPCTPPLGFDASSATITQQIGETGFSIHGNTTANRIVIGRAPVMATQNTLRYRFNNVTNPSTPYVTAYLRIATHASDDGTGANIDEGGIAFVPNASLSLQLFVPPYMSFCTGIEISGLDCATATGNRLGFGELDETVTRSAESEVVITTNAADGYNITVSGPTMTSGNNVIPRLSSPTSSNTGSSQFGLNLRDNSAPDVGKEIAGLNNGSPRADYNSPNLFTFNSGDIIASSPIPDASTYTASYIVNVDPDQAPGIYTTTLTYVAFATF